MTRPTYVAGLFLLAFALAACGGTPPPHSRALDESADLSAPAEARASTPRGPRQPLGQLANTRWRWVEASCTEGPLNLAARGFSDELFILQEGPSYTLVHDQEFAAEQCKRTVVQIATPGAGGPEDDWQMSEEQRIALPATAACEGIPERPRPGEVRRAGNFLEVLVQRSDWCNGYEARMAYAPAPNGPPTDEQVIRRYVISFNRKNPAAIGSLFAETGSLVESFTTNEDGGPTRHDGREAVIAWYTESFQNLPWVALRMTGLEPGSQAGRYVMSWEYMDPRLQAPLTGRNNFTLAAGEIFEGEIELTGASATAAATPAAPAAGAAGAATPAAATPATDDADHPNVRPRRRRTR